MVLAAATAAQVVVATVLVVVAMVAAAMATAALQELVAQTELEGAAAAAEVEATEAGSG